MYKLNALLRPLFQLLQPLRQRFDTLPANDKRALVIMCVTILVACTYLLLSGTYSYQQKSLAYYKDAIEDLRWINLNKEQLQKLAGSQSTPATAAGSTDSLIAVASGAAKPFGITFKRFQPEGDTSLRLWIEAAEFDKLLKWIDVLNKQGIVLDQLDVDRLEKQVGMVDARVLLRRD